MTRAHQSILTSPPTIEPGSLTRPRRGTRVACVAGLALLTTGIGGCRVLRPDQNEPEPVTSETAAESAPEQTRVVDERPSARYRVETRAADRPAEPVASVDDPVIDETPREPALTPEDLVSDDGSIGTSREARALASARELRAMGDIQAALAELERAIAINPRFTLALLEAGDLQMELGAIASAERSYAAAARAEPRNYDTQYRHATALSSLGRSEEAIRAYLRSLAVRPNAFDAMLGLSRVYLESGDPEQALPYAERSARSQPRSGAARMHLGVVLAALDRHEDAVVEYRQAAELLPKPAPDLLLNMAESFSRLGRYAEMVGALTEVVSAQPSPVAYERLGSGLFRLRRYDEALEAFVASSDLDPSYTPALNGIAVCELNNYLWSGKSDGSARERAVDAMRRSLRLDRSQPKIVELLRRYASASPQERAG